MAKKNTGSENYFKYPENEVSSFFYNGNEIDLIEWVVMLLASFRMILTIVIIFVLTGYGVARILPQKWISHAVIIAPQGDELASLDKLKPQFSVLGVDFNISEKELLSLFARDFDSQVLRREYLINTDFYKRLIKDVSPGDDLTRRRVLDTLATHSFSSVNSELSKKSDDAAYPYYKLSFTADRSEDAKKTLEDYISVVNASVEKYIENKIQRSIDLRLSTEEARYEMMLSHLKNEKEVSINRLGYSLSIAEAAGVKRPLYSNGTAIKDDPDFSVALGSDGIRRKLEIEQSIPDLSQLNAGVRDSQVIIGKLRGLKLSDVRFTAYKYLMMPDEPVGKDEPKVALIVILSALSGLLVAVGMVTVRHFLRCRSRGEKMGRSSS